VAVVSKPPPRGWTGAPVPATRRLFRSTVHDAREEVGNAWMPGTDLYGGEMAATVRLS
jgi:hypothetical protein